MKKRLISVLFTGLLLTVLVGIGNAAPIQWGVNGHYYEVVDMGGNYTWDQARLNALSSSYLGMQGHLVTLTSVGESDFIISGLSLDFTGTDVPYWLGGYYDGATWNWVTSEAFIYTNWSQFNPANDPDFTGMTFKRDGAGEWDDVHFSYTGTKYIIEYDTPFGVPEPATILLIGLGLAGFSVVGIKRKRS